MPNAFLSFLFNKKTHTHTHTHTHTNGKLFPSETAARNFGTDLTP